jgi:hypothetical protein
VLDKLRAKKKDGRFQRISGETLGNMLEKKMQGAITITTITGCAKTLRANIKKRLLKEWGYICDDHDVLVRDEQGYHLNDDKITVEDGQDEE